MIHIKFPFYLLQILILVALTASLYQGVQHSQVKAIPKLVPTNEFVYREGSGTHFILSDIKQFLFPEFNRLCLLCVRK